MSKRVLTREERMSRRIRIVHLLSIIVWFMFVATILVASKLSSDIDAQTSEAIEEAVVTPVVSAEPEVATTPPSAPMPTPEPYPEPDTEPEPEPQESSPIREDIPLDTETQTLLYQACDETGVQYELALAVVWKETRFQNITGDNGNSIGYMQVKQHWHTERMERLGVTDLTDPYGNFVVGCDLLAELLGRGRGLEWALMAYNGGPSYANKMTAANKVSQYVYDVLNYMNNLGGN